MIYGYARVSATGQSIHGNSLEDQTRALQNYGCREIVTEAFTGKSMERPVFSALFQKLGPGDTLVVTKLDRFASTAIDGFLRSESYLIEAFGFTHTGRQSHLCVSKLDVEHVLGRIMPFQFNNLGNFLAGCCHAQFP